MAACENECGSSQLPKRKLPVSDSDEVFSDFSSESSGNYIPDEAEASSSSKVEISMM
jgi:hypothetical protein